MQTTSPTAQPRPTRRARLVAPLRFLWRLLLAAAKLLLLVVVLLLVVGGWLYAYYGRDLPDARAIQQHRAAETTRIYAQDGRTLLFELVDPHGGRRTVVPFDRIPATLKDATIAVEDASFYDHPGVDLRGITRALWLNYQHGEIVSGGSTITQQLVRAILLPRVGRGPDASLEQRYEYKVREAILAFRVTREFSKDQILGLYLNEVYYGAQAYGVEAAAQTYFGKHVWELSAGEATLLAGLPQSPTQLNPFTNMEAARARQRITLDLMVKSGYLTPQQAEQIYAEPLELAQQQHDIIAPHFVFYVRDLLEERYGPEMVYNGGLRVTTSIDLAWQAEAQRIALARIDELRPRNAHNAAVVMLAPDGRLLAMVGSIDYHNPVIDGEVNVALALRQPGSALKPLIYATAMQQGWTPATVIWDVPTTFTWGGVPYAPQNYDNSWHGPQRVRMALANSLNIPAVKALEYVGVQRFVQQAAAMGVTTLHDPERYGLHMALGSVEVRLLELSSAYNTFRNGGRYQPPVAILRVTNNRGEVLEEWSPQPGRPVLGPHSEQIAYLITDMLSDNQARRYMFGAGNVMELPDGRPAAVKTGTSNDWRDSWAIGYTTDVLVGVWVGNNDNAPMQEIAGSNGAGLIWRDVMHAYHEGSPPEPFSRPAQIVEQDICAHTGGMESEGCPRSVSELFVAGTEPLEADVIYQDVRVAQGGTCLAAAYTPARDVRIVTYAIYPPAFRDWANRNGIPQPPSERCPPPQSPGDEVARLDTPQPVPVGEQMFIRGIARGAYTLTYGSGRDPASWLGISQQRTGSTLSSTSSAALLGVWDTAGLAPGNYSLRLRVRLPDGAMVESVQVVQLQPAP
jgi:penicillin-binding protein 1C